MICSTPKLNGKIISEMIRISLWPPFSQDHNALHYAIRGVLENETNANSHPNIGLLKKEWNKMSEEIVLKACKSFRHVDTIIEENGGHI